MTTKERAVQTVIDCLDEIKKLNKEWKMNRKSVEDFVRIKCEHSLLKYANNIIVHECPQCKKRYVLAREKHFGIDEIVNFFMEIYDGSEAIKLYMLTKMKETTSNEEKNWTLFGK